jgi:D-threonate/D-erythronate kinase
MAQNIAIIGSDINGVMGNASQFANCGARVILFLGASELRDCDVAVLTTNSKHVSTRRAYSKTRDAVRRCSGRKIYLQEDSSLRGNLPSSIQAVIDELNPRKILICLSLPEKKRHVQDGKVYISGVPANLSAAGSDPLSPIKEAHIPTLIYKNTGIMSRVLGFDIIDKGPDAILKHIMDSSERIIVLDALEPHHFSNIAGAIQSGGDDCFSCMAMTLSREIPFVHGYSRDNLKTVGPLDNKKPVLVVIGSYDPVAGAQLRRATEKSGLPVISMETTGLLSLKKRKEKIGEYCKMVIDSLETGTNVAITTNSSRFIHQLRYKMAYLLAEIAAEVLCRCNVGALLTGGSDTTCAICHTLQVQGIDILGSIRTGVSTMISMFHTGNGKLLYMGSRGGANGSPDEMQKTLEILRPAKAIQ